MQQVACSVYLVVNRKSSQVCYLLHEGTPGYNSMLKKEHAPPIEEHRCIANDGHNKKNILLAQREQPAEDE